MMAAAAAGGAEKEPYTIGWGRPPTKHQFKKGSSGNPNGRPRRSAQPAQPDRSLNELILEEAYRPVTVREGGKSIEMSMVQAALRNMGVTAMKGGRLAQRDYVTLIQAALQQVTNERLVAFAGMLDERNRRAKIIEDAVRNGREVPDIVPHPDDFIVDPVAGVVRIVGPLDAREKVVWDEQQQFKNEVLERLAEAQKDLANAGQPEPELQDQIDALKRIVARGDSLYPDAATRRSLSFDPDAWLQEFPDQTKSPRGKRKKAPNVS